jgi:hypothetical protein
MVRQKESVAKLRSKSGLIEQTAKRIPQQRQLAFDNAPNEPIINRCVAVNQNIAS